MKNIQRLIDSGKTIKFTALLSDKELCKEIQEVLISESLLPKGEKADGYFGPITQNALVNYKKKYKITGGNALGPTTFKHILSKYPNRSKPPAPSVGGDLAHRVIQALVSREIPLKDGINIVGIEGMTPDGRKNDDAPDRWNDSLGLLDYDEKTGKGSFLCLFVGTTEPGKYYTFNPLNRRGAARLDLGYHPRLWSFGIHRGYRALAQTGPARLVRDKNKNFFRDDKVTVESGCGINLHTTKTTGWKGSFNDFIGQWSAGCCVIRKPNEFKKFLSILESKTTKRIGFDFYLLWKDWL